MTIKTYLFTQCREVYSRLGRPMLSGIIIRETNTFSQVVQPW